MTTVCASRGEIAADTQLTGAYVFRVQKVMRLHDGGVAGAAGHWAKAYAGLTWLAGGEVGEPPKIKGVDILIIRPDGGLWIAEGEWPAYPLLDKFAAIGAGAQAAVAAMQDGASAVEAVKKAARIDPYTSDPVQTLSIEKKAPRKRGK